MQLRSKIFEMLQNGYGVTEIARLFDLKYNTVKSIKEVWKRGDLGYFGFHFKSQKRIYTMDYKMEVVIRYLDEKPPLKTYARQLGISHVTVKTWIDRYKAGRLV